MDLNDNVVEETLLRLPVKSLLKFRCVCKSWCNIIDSSAFRKSHVKINPSKNEDDNILFLVFKQKSRELSIILPEKWKYYEGFPSFQKLLNGYVTFDKDTVITGPINGLFCVYNTRPLRPTKDGQILSSIAICNPCLGEKTILPLSDALSTLIQNLSFENKYHVRDIGFGFDNVTKDYKILQVIWAKNHPYFEVYSGKTRNWRKLDTNIIDKEELYMGWEALKHTNGSSTHIFGAHWTSRKWYEDRFCMERAIVSFDMHNEVFRIITPPRSSSLEYPLHVRNDIFVRNDNSFLLFGYYTHGRFDSRGEGKIEVWELENAAEKQSWTYVTDFDVNCHVSAIGVWKDGVFVKVTNEKKVNLYDMRTKRERECFEMPKERGVEMFEYKCSLNSLEEW